MNQFKFLDAYSPIFWEDKTYFIISGGRASGKSTNVGAYFLLMLMGQEYFRGVISRYTSKALTNSIYRDILDLIEQWGLHKYLDIKGDEVKNKLNGNLIITHSMKLQEGTMTAKSKGLSKVTHLLVDEATELPSEEEYLKLIDTFRHKGVKRKIFLLFNPTSKNHWIYRRHFLPNGEPNPIWADNHKFLHTTYFDNQDNLDPDKIREWEIAKEQDPDYYQHHILGNWKDIGEGQIFKTWRWDLFSPDLDAETVYGLDFGFASDPSAVVEVNKRGNKIWVRELVYKTGLTTEDLSDVMKANKIPMTANIYADSADPRSIETLRRLGWKNITKSDKGPDSVRAGIDRVSSYEVFADPGSINLIEEYYNYSYRSGTDKPIDSYNHLMDALRYAVASLQTGPRYAVVGKGKYFQGLENF
jgi:phage terminase large subunit